MRALRPEALAHAPIDRFEPGPLEALGHDRSLFATPERLTLLVVAAQIFADQSERLAFFQAALASGHTAREVQVRRPVLGDAVTARADAAVVEDGTGCRLVLTLDVDPALVPERPPPDRGREPPGEVQSVLSRSLLAALAVPEGGRTLERLARFVRFVLTRTRALCVIGEAGGGSAALVDAIHLARGSGTGLVRLDAELDPAPAIAEVLAAPPGARGVLVRRLDAAPAAIADAFLAACERPDRPGALYATLRAGERLGARLAESGALDLFEIPSLRTRPVDIVPAFGRLIRRPVAGLRAFQSIHPDAARALERYAWPGNAAEMREVADLVRQISGGSELRLEDLPLVLTERDAGPKAPLRSVPPHLRGRRGRPPKEISVAAIRAALSASDGNRSEAARRLGVSRTTLWRKIAELGDALMATPEPTAHGARGREIDRALETVRASGVSIPPAAGPALAAYLDALRAWSGRVNLVSARDLEELVDRHLLPSLAPLLAPLAQPDDRPLRYADLGSGGGFPGVVLSIVRPLWASVLYESIRKKALFLEEVTAPVPNARVVRGRFESTEGEPRDDGPFDLVTARAVAPPRAIYGWVHERLAPGGELHVFVARDEHDRLAGELSGAYPGADVLAPIRAPFAPGWVLRVGRG